jgi:peptidoglycan/xylan/chitin deacetylase (PgdA/CDA1 family)
MNDVLRFAVKSLTRGARGILINNHAQDADQIRKQVDALAPLVEFIGYEDLAARLKARPAAKPFCLLTFDDGKAISSIETAPELLRMGVPAVFYLVTGLTGTDRCLWFDRLMAVRRARPDRPLPAPGEFKTIPWACREEKIEKLCSSLGIDANPDDPSARLMSWEQAADLQDKGFEMGSHTVDHAILTCETKEEAARQITESVGQMTRNGLRCRTFAFPNGNRTDELVETALAAGVESTVSTVPTWIRPRSDLRCLPRLFIKESADVRHIQRKLLAARAGCLLKNPNGEGRRYLFSV